jgi:DNA-binding CsgD family transcriptional regulator/sugar-specific transcriptional regulator TrmB
MTLRELGLSPVQEAAYRRLIAGAYGDVDTLAGQIGAPADDVRGALTGLVALGVLQDDPQQPLGLRVPRPTVAVGQLIERVEDELMQRYRRISDTRATLAELEASYVHGTQRDDTGAIERVENVAEVRERLEELAFFTRSSVYAVQPGGPKSKESLDASRPLDQRGLRRGLDMRVLHDRAVLDDELNRAYLRELVGGGARVRVSRQPLSRMVIMDREIAVVPLDPGDSRRGALVVRQPGLVAGLIDLFSRLWSDAEELDDPDDVCAPPPLPEPPADHDRQVLALLASGATDETSARELGVSVRHLRRTIARLMTQLGASSRFEAGVEATRRGWI